MGLFFKYCESDNKLLELFRFQSASGLGYFNRDNSKIQQLLQFRSFALAGSNRLSLELKGSLPHNSHSDSAHVNNKLRNNVYLQHSEHFHVRYRAQKHMGLPTDVFLLAGCNSLQRIPLLFDSVCVCCIKINKGKSVFQK